MKKAITILTICLLAFAGTLTAQAQTKEETIAWIKEKMEKYGGDANGYVTDVQVSSCKISWREEDNDIDYEGYYHMLSFNPNSAKDWKISDGGIQANAKVIILRSYNPDGENYGNYTYSEIDLRNGELDIRERMIKALLHLATFCDEGKNEAF